jgi:3'(2'), 5'-bisphosphate nucleotidase
MDYQRELTTALGAARLAAEAILDCYAEFQVVPDAPAEISTEADRRSQDIILDCLHRSFPDDALCAEEASALLQRVARQGARQWVVDPIDGTRGFARKNGEFSVMIGFVDQGRVALGVVLEPAFHRLTYAAREHGTWMQDGDAPARRCRVSATERLADATLIQSRSSGRRPAYVAAIGPAAISETYSAGIKLARVARGEADLYVNTYAEFHDWDVCAGHLLVEEAGGRVSGLAGEEVRYGLADAVQRHGLLATNGVLHEAAIAALRGTQA